MCPGPQKSLVAVLPESRSDRTPSSEQLEQRARKPQNPMKSYRRDGLQTSCFPVNRIILSSHSNPKYSYCIIHVRTKGRSPSECSVNIYPFRCRIEKLLLYVLSSRRSPKQEHNIIKSIGSRRAK